MSLNILTFSGDLSRCYNLKSMQLNLEDLKKRGVLGEGTYGKCYLVQHASYDSLWVLKQIQTFGMNETQKEEVIRQARILEALNHPCIVKFLTSFNQDNYLNIVMEYADGGDLNQAIRQAKKNKETHISEDTLLNWFTQICLAIKHVHDRKVIHRDLKTQNIFLTKEGFVKLGDFGIAKPLMLTLDKIKTVVGTPYYMSPEICDNHPYSFKTDIWSLGVILYEMCALKPPFDGNSLTSLALKITKGEYSPIPSIYSKQMKKLVTELLQVKPEKRPTIKEILEKPILQKRIKKYLTSSVRLREFSHTTLHSKNIFEKENERDEDESLKCEEKKIKNEVISPRNNPKQFVKTPQNKNIDFSNRFKDASSGQKQGKKKKVQAFKRRQISQPNLAPNKFSKNQDKNKQMKQNNSMVNLEKKKSDKEKKDVSFKKNKEAFIFELQQIRECRSEVIELKEQYSQRVCSNLIVEEDYEEEAIGDGEPKQSILEALEQIIRKKKGKKEEDGAIKENPLGDEVQNGGLQTLLWGFRNLF